MAETTPPPDALPDDKRQAYVEEMGLLWEQEGLPRMQGRVLGYLMLSNTPHSSSADVAAALHASTGSISLATRALADAGYIRRVAVTGQRSHFFRADDDVWGAFLAGQRIYLERQHDYAETVLAALGRDDSAPRRRLNNMRDYMTWVSTQHRRLRDEWEDFKRQRDAGETSP